MEIPMVFIQEITRHDGSTEQRDITDMTFSDWKTWTDPTFGMTPSERSAFYKSHGATSYKVRNITARNLWKSDKAANGDFGSSFTPEWRFAMLPPFWVQLSELLELYQVWGKANGVTVTSRSASRSNGLSAATSDNIFEIVFQNMWSNTTFKISRFDYSGANNMGAHITLLDGNYFKQNHKYRGDISQLHSLAQCRVTDWKLPSLPDLRSLKLQLQSAA